MQIFVILVLGGAALLSAFKLALLPRLWRIGAVAVVLLPVLLFQRDVANVNFGRVVERMANTASLESICLLVVVQELVMLVIGWRLLDVRRVRRSRMRWRLVSLLPSLLLPGGALYLELFVFNAFPSHDFTVLALCVYFTLSIVLLLIAELARLLAAGRDSLVAAVVGIDYFLLLATVFLPVAVSSELSRSPDVDTIGGAALLTLGVLAGITLVFFLLHWTIQKIEEHIYALHHSNS